jgi:hypothetical protein
MEAMEYIHCGDQICWDLHLIFVIIVRLSFSLKKS